jgi:hypothetical protein
VWFLSLSLSLSLSRSLALVYLAAEKKAFNFMCVHIWVYSSI